MPLTSFVGSRIMTGANLSSGGTARASLAAISRCPSLRSCFQGAVAGGGARAFADQLHQVVAGACLPVRTAGQDESGLGREHVDLAVLLAGAVHDRGEPLPLDHPVTGLDVVEDDTGPRC